MLWTVRTHGLLIHRGYQCNSYTNGPEHVSFCFCLSRKPLNVKLCTAECMFTGSKRWWDCFDLIIKRLNVWSHWKFPLFLCAGGPDLHASTPTHAHTEPVSEATALRNFLWSCNTLLSFSLIDTKAATGNDLLSGFRSVCWISNIDLFSSGGHRIEIKVRTPHLNN